MTGALAVAFGDIVSQVCFESNRYNVNRTLMMGTLGFLETKLEVIYWFHFLDYIIGSKQSMRNSILKTLIDVFFFVPFEIILCIGWVEVFENRHEMVAEKVKSEFLGMLKVSYLIWVPFGFINFYFVPVRFRAIYNGAINLVWDTYLSYASHVSIKD